MKWRDNRFQSVFRPNENENPAFSTESSGLESVFEKLCFRDGLVWTVGLTEEEKLRFQISLASVNEVLASNDIQRIRQEGVRTL